MSGGKYSRPLRLVAVGGTGGGNVGRVRYLQTEDTAFEAARRLGRGLYRLDKVGACSPAPAGSGVRVQVNQAGGVVVWRG